MLQKTDYLSGVVYVDPQENIGRHIVHFGVYEPEIIRIVRNVITAGFDFVDVGANIGLHTLAAGFARQTERQTFTAFEPEPAIFEQLKQNCAENNLRIDFHPVGMSDSVGEMTLYHATDQNAGGHSFIHRDNTEPAETVQVRTLDSMFSGDGAQMPTLIKIDVEGFETRVLRGGRKWLSQLKDAVILVEVTPSLGDENDLLAELDAAGFSQRMIVHDFDTFDRYGRIYNDYFNIACWKGERAEAVMGPLAPEITIKNVPENAVELVDWQRFSSALLGSPKSPQQLDFERALAQLEAKLTLKEFEFDSPNRVMGALRRFWYGIGAKWGVRYVIDHQSNINRELFDLIKAQQAEIEDLRSKQDS